MTYYAVLIGNSQFLPEANLSPLSSPTRDIEGLAVELKAEGRGLFNEVITLANQSGHEIRTTLNRILRAATKNDLILIFYSGHGLPNNQNNDLYLATADTDSELLQTTALSFDQIYKLIGEFYCKKVVIILDCCYSGTAGQVFKGDISSRLKTLNDKVMGTYLITATSNDQVALDLAEGGYSLFTKHMISGLRGAADREGSGKVKIGELFHYVRENVTAENPSQVPKRFLKDENGELVLAKSGKDSRKDRTKKIKSYLLDLAKDNRISHDILSEALKVISKPISELNYQEKLKDKLIAECFENNDPLQFVREWDRLEQTADGSWLDEVSVWISKNKSVFGFLIFVMTGFALIFSKLLENFPIPQTEIGSIFERRIVIASSQVEPQIDRNALTTAVGVPTTPIKKIEAPVSKKTMSPIIDMVAIPAGDYHMGCQQGRDNDCIDNEKPAHSVHVSAFQMGRTEVTLGQFRTFVEATKYQTTAETQESCESWIGGNKGDVKGYSWKKPGFAQTENDPVSCVSWDDTQAFIAWLNKTVGGGYRLPSEAEWEYACRAGGDSYYCGDNQVDTVAWYDGNSGKKTHPVASKQANTFGLSDMSGNVWEWVADTEHVSYNGAPVDGSVWSGNGVNRAIRGGSWLNNPRFARASMSGMNGADKRSNNVGLRLARTLP